MTIKLTVDFVIKLFADGSSTSIAANMISDPFSYVPSGALGMGALNTFAMSAARLPTSVQGLVSSDNQQVTAVIGLLGAITFTWPAPPAAGVVTVTGILVF